MGAHHKTKSPSSLPAKNQCLHYESGEAGLPARKGSILHKCFELAASGKPIPTSWGSFSKEGRIELLEGGVLESDFGSVTAKDLEGILWAIQELEEIVRNVSGEERSIPELVAAGEARLERKVSVYGPDFAEITFGSLDFDFLSILVDLKTGRVRNYREQMLSYSLAKMQESGLENVLVVELYSRERRSISYFVSKKEAEEVIFDLSDRIDRKDEFDPVPCEYCGWCSNNRPGGCAAIQDRAALVQEKRPDLFPSDISFHSSEVLSTALAAVRDFQENPDDLEIRAALEKVAGDLAFLYDCAKAASTFLSGVEHSVKEAISSGIKIPGLKAKTSSGRGKITDAKKVFEISGLDADSFLSCVSVSSTNLCDLIGNPATLTRLFEDQEVAIPERFLGKKGQLLKSNLGPALNFLLEEKGLLSRGADSISIVREKPSSSLRDGDEVPEELLK